MTIAKLAAAGGVGVETVRYYQRRGLVGTPERSGGTAGIRHYDESDVTRLRFIRAAQAAGFTLEQIGELIALEATDERVRVRELAATRVAALEARIEEMSRARDALRRLVRTCSAVDSGPCPILAAFERA
jgi:MerR family mercuric resistance operon transcriptional regulator